MDTNANIIECEKWLPVKGFEGLYEVSNKGRIYSFPRKYTKGGYSIGNETKSGHLHFTLSSRKEHKNVVVPVHKLVYETFVGQIPKGYVIHHKNRNPKDNRVENLELMDGTSHKRLHYSKPVLQLTKDGKLVAEYKSLTEASNTTGINIWDISNVCNHKVEKTQGYIYYRNTAGGFVWKFKE